MSAKHFDGYHFAATVRYLATDEVEIVGVAKQRDGPTLAKSDWIAIVDCFKSEGIKKNFRRIKNGVPRDKWLDISGSKRHEPA